MLPSKSQEVEVTSPDSNVSAWPNVHITTAPVKSRLSSLIVWSLKQRISTAALLPNEVLLHIFRYIKRFRMDPTGIGIRPRDHMRALPLVCKGWYGAATNVFYNVIEFPRVHSVLKFHRSLSSRPHLRKLVKVLYFPGRVGRPCPPNLYRTFLQIIALVEDLEELYTMSHIYEHQVNERHACILPIPLDRHSNLKGLHLFADSLDHTVFPTIILHRFQKLESLALHGHMISSGSNLSQAPTLPNLVTFTMFGGGAGAQHLDLWLCGCPRLTSLVLRYAAIVGPLALFGTGKITTLELCYWQNWAPTVSVWLQHSRGVKHLTVNYAIFSEMGSESTSLDGIYPTSLQTLTVKMYPAEDGVEGVFKKFAASRCAQTLLQFTIPSCRHQSWVRERKAWLQGLFPSGDDDSDRTKFSWDNERKCRCQGQVADAASQVFHPMTKWCWHRVQRFASEDTIRMIEWEWPGMRKA